MYCYNCGKELPEDSNYCSECETDLMLPGFDPYEMPNDEKRSLNDEMLDRVNKFRNAAADKRREMTVKVKHKAQNKNFKIIAGIGAAAAVAAAATTGAIVLFKRYENERDGLLTRKQKRKIKNWFKDKV